MNRVLAVRGQVVPATATPLTLHAELADGTVVDGQSRDRARAVDLASLGDPDRRPAPREDALAAIAEAELIVLGPGSLYTSLLPSLLLPEIRDAVAASPRPPRLRLQRRDAGRRDDRVRPGRPRRGARRATPAPTSSTPSSRTTSSGRGCRPATAPRRSGSAGRRRSPPRRSSCSTTSSIQRTATTTIRPASRRRCSACTSARAATGDAPASPGPRSARGWRP